MKPILGVILLKSVRYVILLLFITALSLIVATLAVIFTSFGDPMPIGSCSLPPECLHQ